MTQVVAFALALLIGVTLGVLGGGGSILTVPVFVYVMGIDPKDAVAMSLPVVGTTSLVGAVGHWRAGNVDRRALVVFAPLAMLGALGGARIATLVSGRFQLILLGVAMLVAGALMLRDTRPEAGGEAKPGSVTRTIVLAGAGLLAGALTGLVGVGGGFLIVPALVLLAAVPIKHAIGTSLVVIGLSTISAFAAYRGQAAVAWRVVAIFTALAVVGAIAGAQIARRVPARALRRAFGALVLSLGAFLLYQNRAAGVPAGAPSVRNS